MGRRLVLERKRQITIQMPEDMFEDADKHKNSLGCASFSEYVRRLIERDLKGQNKETETEESVEETVVEKTVKPEIIEKPVNPLIEEYKKEIISKLTEYLKNYTSIENWVAFSAIGLDRDFSYKTFKMLPNISDEFRKYNIELRIRSNLEMDINILSSDNFREFKKSQSI